MTTTWWTPLDPLEHTVACGDTTHGLRWQEGELHTPDHPDVDAERTLGALGAEVPRCVQLKAAWARHEHDVHLVSLGRRPGDASLGVDTAVGHASPVTPAARRRADLLRLLSLPVAFIDRLVLSSLAAAADGWSNDAFRSAHGLRLGAALSARAAPALRRFATLLTGDDAPMAVASAPAAPDAPASIRAERTADGVFHLSAGLPLEWLASVWGTGISEPDGALVLRVTDGDVNCLGVEVAMWKALGEAAWHAVPEPAELTRDGDGRWVVTPR